LALRAENARARTHTNKTLTRQPCAARQADREKKLADKYKMVKFFEQQKLLRRLKSLTKKIDKVMMISCWKCV
jgi:hypothetical protein